MRSKSKLIWIIPLIVLGLGLGVMAGNSTFKKLQPGINILGGTSDPTGGAGDMYFNSSTNKFRQYDGSSWTDIGSGSGTGGGINYDTNPNAETDTTGYATYADAAGNIPVDCTGGTATNLTFSRSTSSPLRGTGSFSMVQANSTSLQGKGVSYAFTIDSADKGQVEVVSFDYNASSTFVPSDGTTPPLNDGTTTTNAGNSDVELFVYDVTNASFIPVTPQVLTSNGANNSKFFGTFQTASNSTSYRACWHVATTSANATGWAFKFDNISIGPQNTARGPPVTDWVSYTPTFNGFGTPTGVHFYSRRIGDSLEVQGVYVSDTPTGVEGRVSLGYNGTSGNVTIDSTKFTGTSVVGVAERSGSSTTFFGITSLATGANTYINFGRNLSTGGGTSAVNGNDMTNNGETITLFARVPIAGWSSNVDMSNDTDTRVVAARASGTVSSTTAGNIIIPSTLDYDTHGAFNIGTGRYTVPVTGVYQLNGAIVAGAAYQVNIYKNAVSDVAVGYAPAATGSTAISGQIKCVAGDILDIRPNGTTGTINPIQISWARLSGPAAIAQSNTVSMRAYNSATSISGSLTTISWTTVDWDDTGNYSAGTWTCPSPGKYQVNAELTVSGTIALNNTIDLQFQKNGTAISEDVEYAGGAMTQQQASIEDMFRCVPGDTFRVQASTSATLPSIVNSNTKNYLSIVRVGNY